MWDKVKNLIGTVAPTAATIIGGPLAGMVVSGLCKIFGLKSNPTPESMAKKLETATSDQWLAIKKLESDTIIRLKELDIDEVQLDQMGLESARDREVQMLKYGSKDYMTPGLAALIVLGFFGVVYWTATHKLFDEQVLDMLIGILGTSFVQVIYYYFGRPSSKKDTKTIK